MRGGGGEKYFTTWIPELPGFSLHHTSYLEVTHRRRMNGFKKKIMYVMIARRKLHRTHRRVDVTKLDAERYFVRQGSIKAETHRY